MFVCAHNSAIPPAASGETISLQSELSIIELFIVGRARSTYYRLPMTAPDRNVNSKMHKISLTTSSQTNEMVLASKR